MNIKPDGKIWVTAEEGATLAGVCPMTIRNWWKQNKIKSEKFGYNRRYFLSDIQKIIAEGKESK
jgi:hypothetical protein